MGTIRRGIRELYAADAERADALLWGDRPELSRRTLVTRIGLGGLVAALGGAIPIGGRFPVGLIPAALAQSTEEFEIAGKDGRLTVLNDRPINAETPAHLLDDAVTPASLLFVRNNGIPPSVTPGANAEWMLTVDGESCENPRQFSLSDLKREFQHHTYQLQLECAGNGRKEFYPPATGNQWSVGAVGCPRWTGVRLKDVLRSCGVRDDAVYVGYYGADRHLSGVPDLEPISRGVPVTKAMEDESLIAWAMNGEELSPLHGYPLRLVCGGWPGSVSGKWLRRLVVRNRVHDGAKMGGYSYRFPCYPVAPGTDVPEESMCIIESMPVKSLITHPRSGISHPSGQPLAVRGHAWAGDRSVERMHVSIDFGATWQEASLQPPVNRLAWQRWSAEVRFPVRGYYEIWARAVDSNGVSQPMVLPGWNPRGYLNNACHRIAVAAA